MVTGTLEGATLRTVRRVLLLILLLGLAGIATELLLLNHDEEATQIIPLGLIAAALVAVAWHGLLPGTASVRVIQIVMACLVVAGPLGMYYHYGANAEFQREIDPSIGGLALFWKVMAAKAPPALAPGSMSQLGLLGLAYAYRHPALARGSSGRQERPSEKEEESVR